VSTALFNYTGTGIYQHDGQVGRGCARDHVPGVLHVAGCVGDDEFAPGRCEVAVCHVNRDSLLALGPQAVGQIRQVDLTTTGNVSGAFKRLKLIFHQGF
jgi:hypothetical protein